MYWFQVFTFLNILLITLLAINVSRVRIAQRIPNSDGGNLELKKAIRSHINGLEHTLPYGLILLALSINPSGEPINSSILATLVISFTVARIIHLIGMLKVMPMCRMVGAGVTYLCQLIALAVLGLSLI